MCTDQNLNIVEKFQFEGFNDKNQDCRYIKNRLIDLQRDR